MWFVINRIIFWFIVFCGIMFIVKKRKDKTRRLVRSLAIVLSIIGCFLSGMVAVENYFITFSSAEKAYNYLSPSTLAFVIDGEFSSIVVNTDTSKNAISVIPKGDGGWKIEAKSSLNMVFSYAITGMETEMGSIETITYGTGFAAYLHEPEFTAKAHKATITLYRYGTTDDYYISVSEQGSYQVIVSDDRGSEFQYVPDRGSSGGVHYAYIEDYSEPYTLYVDGKSYTFEFKLA